MTMTELFSLGLSILYWLIIGLIIFTGWRFFHRRKVHRLVQQYPIYFNIILLIVSSLCTLMCIEISVRTFFPGKYVYYSDYEGRPMITSFGSYGSMLAPNFYDTLYGYRVYTLNSPLVPWTVRTNQFGWREPEYELIKPQGSKRLMVLGDSVTYGMTINYQHIHSSYLHHALRLDPQSNWEVLNRSVPGWNGWHQREYFRLDGKRWNPDIVTVNVVMNDFKPISDAEYEAAVKKPPIFYNVYKRFQFLNLIRVTFIPKPSEVLEFYRIEVPQSDYGLWNKDKWWYIRGEYDSPEKEALYQKANELSYPRYLKIKQECDKIGAYYLVVIYPTASQTSLKYWMRQKQSEVVLNARPINELCEFLTKNHIPYVNLLDAFRKETTHALFVDEGHLTEYGHRISAEEVLKHLKQQHVIQLYDMPLWE